MDIQNSNSKLAANSMLDSNLTYEYQKCINNITQLRLQMDKEEKKMKKCIRKLNELAQ